MANADESRSGLTNCDLHLNQLATTENHFRESAENYNETSRLVTKNGECTGPECSFELKTSIMFAVSEMGNGDQLSDHGRNDFAI